MLYFIYSTYISVGIATSNCSKNGLCEIYAWCEIERAPTVVNNLLIGVDNFTVFIRVTVKYPRVSTTTWIC